MSVCFFTTDIGRTYITFMSLILSSFLSILYILTEAVMAVMVVVVVTVSLDI